MLAKAIMILLVITLSAPWASAQSTFGDVVGVVKDQNQGGVPGAEVLLTSVDDGSQHQTTSDTDGAFHFVNLKAGNYELVISAAGFSDFKIFSAHLDARQTLRLDVAMKLASASQSIEYPRYHKKKVVAHPDEELSLLYGTPIPTNDFCWTSSSAAWSVTTKDTDSDTPS